MKLTLTRDGDFTTRNMIDVGGKCGIPDHHNYKYSVTVHATDDSLSPEGFVIENGRIHEFFTNKYSSGKEWKSRSCEKMAMEAAEEIAETLIFEGVSVVGVDVTIYGSNHAKITASWDRKSAVRKMLGEMKAAYQSLPGNRRREFSNAFKQEIVGMQQEIHSEDWEALAYVG